MRNHSILQDFYTSLQHIYTLKSVEALLDWDQQVNLPLQGGDARATQLELLATLIHARSTDERLFNQCEELYESLSNLSEDDAVNVRETRRALLKQRKLPAAFVAGKSNAVAKSYQAWTKARPANDFKSVLPYLEEIVRLSIEETKLLGYEEHPYDALLDSYEPYATLSEIKPLLMSVAETLKGMIPEFTARTQHIVHVSGLYPREFQEKLCRKVASDLGYSFETGRLDTAPHPFQSSLGPRDARITTRWDEGSPLSALFSVIHEVGHALYELGFLPQHSGTPMAQAVSLGIHESQSRFWENIVGRSVSFAEYLHRTISSIDSSIGASLSPQIIWEQTNKIEPSLIRVESDEITYSLHIVIRMLLEEALITEDLKVRDLPDAWRDLYTKYLGISPHSDTEGVLQDIHWYSGSIGYFPTYALGNLYGAMMHETMRGHIPSFDNDVKKGAFSGILQWLRTNVHEHGMKYSGPALIKNITGAPLSAQPFIEYVRGKCKT